MSFRRWLRLLTEFSRAGPPTANWSRVFWNDDVDLRPFLSLPCLLQNFDEVVRIAALHREASHGATISSLSYASAIFAQICQHLLDLRNMFNTAANN